MLKLPPWSLVSVNCPICEVWMYVYEKHKRWKAYQATHTPLYHHHQKKEEKKRDNANQYLRKELPHKAKTWKAVTGIICSRLWGLTLWELASIVTSPCLVRGRYLRSVHTQARLWIWDVLIKRNRKLRNTKTYFWIKSLSGGFRAQFTKHVRVAKLNNLLV